MELPVDLAQRQHGLLTRADLVAAGLSRSAIRNCVGTGRIERIAPSLFAVAGAPDTRPRRALSATLTCRAALSHSSAAAWWALPGYQLDPLHVTRLRGGRRHDSDLAVVHAPRLLTPEHVVTWKDVPVTRPGRTLFDLAAVEHPKQVERALDTMWARGLVTMPVLHRLLAELGTRGRTGVAIMRVLIDARRDQPQPAGSRLEQRGESLIERAGLPRFIRQRDLGDDEWIGRVDLTAPGRALVVEIDSDLHHTALSDARHDEERDRRLVAAGWEVMRITEFDLWHRPQDCITRLRAAYAQARPLRDAA